MFIDFLLDTFHQNADAEAVIWRDCAFLYGDLLERINHWRNYLSDHGIESGAVTAVEADFSPNAIALMLALIENGCITVPLTSSVSASKTEFMNIAGVEAMLEFDGLDEPRLMRFESSEAHEIIRQLRNDHAPSTTRLRVHPGSFQVRIARLLFMT